jgi:hypothetical protein
MGDVMLLELQPLTDTNALAALYRDPYIARVGHDHRSAYPIEHPAAHYMGAHVDGEFVGAFLIIESGFIETDVHALLTRRALPNSRELGRMCLHYIFANPAIERITAYVIEGLTAARNYCLKLGFKSEGFRRAACAQNGVLLGIHTMGMTRNDWKGA